ncbi:MAG: acyltransferase [Saprospiraceae bacterium]|nr:acyltransferase [Saprospiraceae bacterium]
MRKLLESIIGNLKNDSSYRLHSDYSSRQLFSIVYYRSLQLIRGFFLKLRISSSGFVFCGRKVFIHYAYQVKVGKNFVIEDGAHINALSKNGITAGDNVTIAKYAVLSCTGVIANKGIGIVIGNNSAIGAQSFLGGQGGIKIGNDVIMGPQVKIFSENHNYSQTYILIRKQGESRKGVTIGDNCWIGAGVTILDGVSIANGCVIAAGSVVTKSIPENAIVAGVPAKVIKLRITL